MNKDLLKVSIRQNALYISQYAESKKSLNETTSVLVVNAAKLGFGFSENLLKAINTLPLNEKAMILESLKEIKGVNKSWTPLIKAWNIPTGESIRDHIITFFANTFRGIPDTKLPCGHVIPNNTFPLERYNGCPYCGTPFQSAELDLLSQGSKLTVLDLWTDQHLNDFYSGMLTAKTALDATQVDSLKTLLTHLSVPKNIQIGMKETLMLVIDRLVELDKTQEAGSLFKSPADIMRYLWFKQTGLLQIVEPKTIVRRAVNNSYYEWNKPGKVDSVRNETKTSLKLKFSRKMGRTVAGWLNDLEMSAEVTCEIMHPKRSMWIRFIRALRLAEYSKRKGFERLKNLLDVFYNELYDVWAGQVDYYRKRNEAEKTFALLKQRPGVFARSMFSNMLWFGTEETLCHAYEIVDKIPARLLYALNMYAPVYFSRDSFRSVKPLGGTNKRIATNKFLGYYGSEQLTDMKAKVEELTLFVMMDRFSKMENKNKTIFIDEALKNIPLSIGDRSETIQDVPSALMGTRFPVEGDSVRLFLQWGTGLQAQHLDMDLSCMVSYVNRIEVCSYSSLTIAGCQHSGDIQKIPEKVGTAEYIELNLHHLTITGAKYVTFTCNAYTSGNLSPNMVVGWMNSKYSMKVSNKTGVAYDPSCVQHQVRIANSNSKGLVFGVLDVEKREIVWLEMGFGGQVVQNMDINGVEALLAKLNSKLSVGHILNLKAEAQGLIQVAERELADEVYDVQWAYSPSELNALLPD